MESRVLLYVLMPKSAFGGYNVYGRSGQDKYKISPDDFAKSCKCRQARL
jgi:hypothetical protein